MSLNEILGIPSEVDKRNNIIMTAFIEKIIAVLIKKKVITEDEALMMIQEADRQIQEKLQATAIPN